MIPRCSVVASNFSPNYKIVGSFQDTYMMPQKISLSSCGTMVASFQWNNAFEVRNIETNRVAYYRSSKFGFSLYDICWRPDFDQVVTSTKDLKVKLWDLQKGVAIRTISKDESAPICCCSPDGNVVTCALEDKNIVMYDLRVEDVINTIKTPSFRCTSLSYSRGGEFILTSEIRGACTIWDVKSLGSLLTLETGIYPLPQAMFTKDYSIITSQPNALLQWNPETSEVLHIYDGHDSSKNNFSANFSIAEDRYLLMGSENHELHIWDLEKRLKVQVLRAHDNPVLRTAAHHYEKIIATSSFGDDSSIRIWTRE